MVVHNIDGLALFDSMVGGEWGPLLDGRCPRKGGTYLRHTPTPGLFLRAGRRPGGEVSLPHHLPRWVRGHHCRLHVREDSIPELTENCLRDIELRIISIRQTRDVKNRLKSSYRELDLTNRLCDRLEDMYVGHVRGAVTPDSPPESDRVR